MARLRRCEVPAARPVTSAAWPSSTTRKSAAVRSGTGRPSRSATKTSTSATVTSTWAENDDVSAGVACAIACVPKRAGTKKRAAKPAFTGDTKSIVACTYEPPGPFRHPPPAHAGQDRSSLPRTFRSGDRPHLRPPVLPSGLPGRRPRGLGARKGRPRGLLPRQPAGIRHRLPGGDPPRRGDGADQPRLPPARDRPHALGRRARLMITERSLLSILDELEPADRAGLERVVLAEELDGLRGDPESPFSPPVVGGSDAAMLLYTSGTTGRSKGAIITHDNVLATVTGLLAAWAWEPADSLLLTLPLFHTHGLVVGLHCALAAGATVLLRRRFDAGEVATGLIQGESTLFFGVPTMYVRLVEELKRRDDRAGLARLRLFCSGSAPLAPET